MWHALSIRYDQCVSFCDCTPWLWPAVDTNHTLSVHFSCIINKMEKPGTYKSESELYAALNGTGGTPCARYYYLRWYAELKKALGGPLHSGGGPAPSINETQMTVLLKRPSHNFHVIYTSR